MIRFHLDYIREYRFHIARAHQSLNLFEQCLFRCTLDRVVVDPIECNQWTPFRIAVIIAAVKHYLSKSNARRINCVCIAFDLS